MAIATIFGSKIDRILRESKCDLLVVKNPKPITSLLLAAHPSGNSPYLKLMGEIFSSLKNYYKAKTELTSILAADTPFYLKPDPQILLKPLGLKRKDFEIYFLKQPETFSQRLVLYFCLLAPGLSV